MAVDRPLQDLIAELRASDPSWQASIVRFRQFRRRQAVRYERRYRDAGHTGQQRGCMCGAAIHQGGDGTKRDLDGEPHNCIDSLPRPRPQPLAVHPETAAQIARGFAREVAKARPKAGSDSSSSREEPKSEPMPEPDETPKAKRIDRGLW